MYEDTWYSFVPPEGKTQKEDIHHSKPGHLIRESLLKLPNEGDHSIPSQSNVLTSFFEDSIVAQGPPEATVARRAKSYSDFYHVVRAQLTKDCKKVRQEYRDTEKGGETTNTGMKFENYYEALEDDLLDSSREEFQLYKDQLALSVRHLDGLLEDATAALNLLTNLSESFKSVESQTTAFQGQCEDLLAEQKRLRNLSNEVGTELKYYAFLEPITRRLNAPGASSMIGDDGFVEMLTSLDSCVEFMIEHPNHRESEVYLARYKSLHERTLNLLRIKFAKLVQGDKDKAKRNANSSEKLTITNLFLYLAPESAGDTALLENAMSHLRIEAFKAAGDDGHNKKSKEAQWFYLKAERSEPNGSPSEHSLSPGYEYHLKKYLETFEIMINDYIATRYDLTPELLARIMDEFDSKNGGEYSHKYSHDIVNAVMEISAFENTKFILIFVGGNTDQRERLGVLKLLDSVEGRSVQFKKFISDLCAKGFERLLPHFANIDISKQVELVVWLNNNIYSTMANDISDDEDTGEDLDPAAFASANNIKHFIAWELSRLVTGHCLSRLSARSLKSIEMYSATPEDLAPHSSAQPSTESSPSAEKDFVDEADIRARADELLGSGLSNAYPPVITAVKMFILFNDMLWQGKMDSASNEFAYTVIHGTCEAILRASKQIATRFIEIDSLIFSIKNLVIVKNVVLALEISGSHRASILDFSNIWLTFSDLRSRGDLLNMRSYYNMLTDGTLLPRVIENVQDARTELDGLLRQTINEFRVACASTMWNRLRKSPEKNHWIFKDEVAKKLKVMFPTEESLRLSLWEAVEELLEEWKAA